MGIKSFLSFLALMPRLCFGTVIESDNLHSILDCVETIGNGKTILVVCDLDNTLMQSTNQLGSVAWGEALIKELEGKGLSTSDAQWTEDLYWAAVHKIMPMQPVDPLTVEIMTKIQNKGIRVIGLTARMPTMSASTVKQVQALGIDLRINDPLCGAKQEFVLDYDALYEDGVLSTSVYNKKSKALKAFFDRNDLQPDWVIFVDDKLHHATDIDSFLVNQGIGSYSIRFSGADGQKDSYDQKIVELQWKAFPKIISDSEARYILGL